MNTYTIDDIRQLEPCYDPARYLPEDWTGTALDILQVTDCRPLDRLWVVCHEGWIDDRTLRLFAVWCARRALALIDNPDPRSAEVCDVAERYANGEATIDELDEARAAIGDVAWGVVKSVSQAAAWDAVMAVAWGVAWAAAWAVARASAWAEAWAADGDATRAAAWDATRAAAWAEAWSAELAHLLEMLELA